MSCSSWPLNSFFISAIYALFIDTKGGKRHGCQLADIRCGDSWIGGCGCYRLQEGSAAVVYLAKKPSQVVYGSSRICGSDGFIVFALRTGSFASVQAQLEDYTGVQTRILSVEYCLE
jgi:hypothetical protein